MTRRANESFFRAFETVRIHPWIPKAYDSKVAYLRKETGLHQEEVITLALYIFFSFLSKKLKEGEDLFLLCNELKLRCLKNLQKLEKVKE